MTALQSPEHYLNFEFQGGEPLLNYPVIRHIVEYAEKNTYAYLDIMDQWLKEHGMPEITRVYPCFGKG